MALCFIPKSLSPLPPNYFEYLKHSFSILTTERKGDSGLIIQKQASIHMYTCPSSYPYQCGVHEALLLHVKLGYTHLIVWLLPGSKFATGILVAFIYIFF